MNGGHFIHQICIIQFRHTMPTAGGIQCPNKFTLLHGIKWTWTFHNNSNALTNSLFFVYYAKNRIRMSPIQIFAFLAFLGAANQQQQQFPMMSPRNAVGGGPLRLWHQDRFVRCIFCMNYDDYNNLSTFGCELRRVATCVGNICYMRQHKRPEYFLYTSGCLNLTRPDLAMVRAQIPVGSSVNTCICVDRSRCNNVTSVEPFVEYGTAIFTAINFDEHLLPNEPMLAEFERERSRGNSYFLVNNSPPPQRQILIIIFLSVLRITANCIIKNAFF
ncbi:hypothetical protein GPALN_014420 [Globodera pallida]|nr:hypothetical protein GPALN_014420 [Globodera pallida]